jgi:hypothetical protein
MDLRWEFNNIRIRGGDEHKATFVTPMGLYQPSVMQFGLCNALVTFQRMVDKILLEEKNSGSIEVYVDNILIHMKNEAENHYWMKRILLKLEENRLFCRKEKCVFEAKEVEFLGVQLNEGNVSISPRKTQAIMEEQPPNSKKGVRRFLGITNYHRKFIKDYSKIARPLHDLTKDVKFEWADDCQEAFKKLKTALASAPVLALPRENLQNARGAIQKFKAQGRATKGEEYYVTASVTEGIREEKRRNEQTEPKGDEPLQTIIKGKPNPIQIEQAKNQELMTQKERDNGKGTQE